MPCRSPGPHPWGEVEGSGQGGLQAHSQGEVEGSGWGGVSRLTPRGKLRGLAVGGVPGPHPVGRLRCLAKGISRPTSSGEVKGSGRGGGLQAHTQGGVYPSMH